MRKKVCTIIYNPQSGKLKNKESLEDLYNIVTEYNYHINVIYTKGKGDAIRIMEELAPVDLVICAGGDGTLNECVTGNLRRHKPLLLSPLPLGTTNDVGAMLGYTGDYCNNLRLLLDGEKKRVDVCTINGRPFVYSACIGNYVDIAYSTPRKYKSRFGHLGYIIYGIRRIFDKLNFFNIEYTIDNKNYSGNYSFVFITNTNHIAGVKDIYDDIKLDDDCFEVVFCKMKTKKELVKALVELKTKGVPNISDIEFYQTNNLEITFKKKPKTSWCIDGEEFKNDNKKFIFQINKDMNMLIPKKNIDKLFIEKK